MSIDSCSKYILASIRLASCLSRNRILRSSTGCGVPLVLLLVLTSAPSAISQTTPYSVSDVEKLAKAGISEHDFLESIKQHGIGFAPTLEVMETLKASHVPDSVLKEIWTHIPQGQAPEFYLREGDRLLKSGYYPEAVAYYWRILAQLPDDPTAKGRVQQATELLQKAEAQAEEQRQKAEAEAKLRAAQDNERSNLPYYRQQLSEFLQKSDCDGAFYYAHKIFFVGPDQSGKAAFEKVCGPYSLTLENGTPVTLQFQRDLTGSGAHPGDRIDFTVVDPIVVNGLLVVPQGGVAWGKVTKSAGGRSLLRVGKLGISIEGMSLVDGESCSLKEAETYHGEKKSKKGKTGIVIGTVLTGGLTVPFLIHGHGKDVKIAAGTRVTAHAVQKMNLNPIQFVSFGPTPKGDRIVLPPVVTGLSVISLDNRSGSDVLVRLLGPSAQTVTVPDGQPFGARVAVGDYYVLVRYGKSPSEYLFDKAGPIPVTETGGKHSVVHITLQRPAADNPKAREEFYKGQ